MKQFGQPKCILHVQVQSASCCISHTHTHIQCVCAPGIILSSSTVADGECGIYSSVPQFVLFVFFDEGRRSPSPAMVHEWFHFWVTLAATTEIRSFFFSTQWPWSSASLLLLLHGRKCSFWSGLCFFHWHILYLFLVNQTNIFATWHGVFTLAVCWPVMLGSCFNLYGYFWTFSLHVNAKQCTSPAPDLNVLLFRRQKNSTVYLCVQEF